MCYFIDRCLLALAVMEIYSNSSLLIRHRGENVFFSNDFCRKSGFFSLHRTHENLIPNNDWRRRGENWIYVKCSVVGKLHGLLMFSTKDYFQFLPQKDDTTRWMRGMVCGEIDGYLSERKTKMLPGKNWFWEMGINTGLEGEEKHKLRPNQLF